MEEDKVGAGSSARVSSLAIVPAPAPAPVPLDTAPPPPTPLPADPPRQRFTVELKPGETTIVSWKKLTKQKSKPPVQRPKSSVIVLALPAKNSGFTSHAVQAAEDDGKDAVPPSSRFSAVIEKIERLYMGKSSDDEELDDIPDEDQYDTEDSFIDDAELDEYFEVDKMTTKHDGYFVNRGQLERVEPSSSPTQAPKKRRNDSPNKHSKKDPKECTSSQHGSMGNVRMKVAARNVQSAEKKSATPTEIRNEFSEYYQNGKHSKNKLDAPRRAYKKKSCSSTINLESKAQLVPFESKDSDKHMADVVPSRNFAHKSRGTSDSSGAMYRELHERGVSSQVESLYSKLSKTKSETGVPTKLRHKEMNGIGELLDLNSSAKTYPMQKAQPSSVRAKEGLLVRPKGTTLDRAIRDLEKIVLASRPPNIEVQEVDSSSQAVKRRLPQEIKQKLGKIARLSASQGKISEELIDRLMGTLGHLVQRNTLKRKMKEMVRLSLSAKKHKADKFQQLQDEVHEMIRIHVSQLKPRVTALKDGSGDDFQEGASNDERRVLKGKSTMDKALEDKICDLYDLYVEGVDEDKGSQTKKLYVQLSELWPNGYMDNLGIKNAINRSKDRKRALHRRHKTSAEEKIKRKRLASSMKIGVEDGIKRKKLASSSKTEETSRAAQVNYGQGSIDSTSRVCVSQETVIRNQPPVLSSRMADASTPLSDSGHHNSKHYDKARGAINAASTDPEEGGKIVVPDVKKRIRKYELDTEQFSVLPKLPVQQVKEKLKQHTESNVATLPALTPQLPLPASSFQLSTLPGSNQPS